MVLERTPVLNGLPDQSVVVGFPRLFLDTKGQVIAANHAYLFSTCIAPTASGLDIPYRAKRQAIRSAIKSAQRFREMMLGDFCPDQWQVGPPRLSAMESANGT